MSSMVTRLWVDLHYFPKRDDFLMRLCYKPVIVNDAHKEVFADEYDGNFSITHTAADPTLTAKIGRLADYLMTTVVRPRDVELAGEILQSPAELENLDIVEGHTLVIRYRVPPSSIEVKRRVQVATLTEASQRLVANIMPTLHQLAWS